VNNRACEKKPFSGEKRKILREEGTQQKNIYEKKNKEVEREKRTQTKGEQEKSSPWLGT